MKARNEILLGRLQNLPPATATAIGLLCLAVVGVADFITPAEMSLTLFYLVGVAFIGWCAGPWLAMLGTAFASGLLMANEFTPVHPNYALWILVWNESTRFLFIAAIGLMAAGAGVFARRMGDLVIERTVELRSEAEHHKATAGTLAEMVERFEQVVNNITEVFWLSDMPKNQILYISPGYERVWGHKCEELYRDPKSWAESVHPDDREEIIKRSLADQAHGDYDVEYRIIRPDGAVRWIRDRTFPVRNYQGEIYRIVGLTEDITERQRTEEALRQSEEALRAFLNAVPEPAMLLDGNGAVIVANRTLAQNLDVAENELVGKPVFDFLPPEVAAKRKAVFDHVIANGEAVQFEDSRDDRVFINWMSPVTDLAGKVSRVAVFGFDVTERKRAEAVLQESEQTYRALVETTGTGYLILDMQGRVLDANAEYVRLSGHQALQEILGRSVAEWTGSQDRLRNAAAVEECAKTGAVRNLEITYTGPNGLLTPILINGTVVRTAKGENVISLCWDITERRLAEQALRQAHDKLEQRVQERTAELQVANTALSKSEARLRLALEYIETIYQNAPIGLCALDVSLRYVRINERLAAMNGKTVGSHIGRTLREAVPHLADETEAICQQVIATAQPVLNRELEGMTEAQPGVARTWVLNYGPLTQSDGCVTGVSIVMEEVTERKRMEQALRDSAAKYRRLHESMMDAFVSVDMEGRIIESNRAYQALLGYTAEELSLLTYMDLTPEKWHPSEALLVAEQILVRGYSDVYEKEYRRKDGTVFPVELRAFLLREGGGKPAGIWGIARDITERKRAAAELIEAHNTLEHRVRERTAELQAANGALSQSETRYRSLVNNLNVGVYRNQPGPDGGFVHANPALARMHGYDSVEEFQKVRVASLYQEPCDRDQLLADLRRLGTVLNYELQLKKRDGTSIYASVNASAHLGPDGEVEWIDGVLEDITERKRAEDALRQSEARIRAIVTGAPLLLCAVDRDGIIRFEDGQALQALGAEPGANLGRPVKEVYAHIPALVANVHRALGGEAFGSVVQAGPVVFDFSYSPARDQTGKLNGFISVATNITERHHLERQLLEISDREQARIGQDIHDGLCQHLVSLAFDANALLQELSAQGRPETRTARRIADVLDQTITEARQLSRGLFPVRLETEGLPSALEELVATISDRFKLKCSFASMGPLAVENSAIATHLYRIAQEAVSNAIKHSRAQKISIRLIGRAGALELSVEDDGLGLSAGSRKQATGMGLHIMAYRARTIGGTLDIGPGQPCGTLVSCCIPRMRQ